MKVTLEVELKHCPFCGHNVALIGRYKSQGFIEIYVQCPKCWTTIHYDFCSQDEAIKRWNRRANP